MHYLTNSRSIYLHAFHFTHLNQPLKYATLLHYSHIPNTLKNNLTHTQYIDDQIYAPTASCFTFNTFLCFNKLLFYKLLFVKTLH